MVMMLNDDSRYKAVNATKGKETLEVTLHEMNQLHDLRNSLQDVGIRSVRIAKVRTSGNLVRCSVLVRGEWISSEAETALEAFMNNVIFMFTSAKIQRFDDECMNNSGAV